MGTLKMRLATIATLMLLGCQSYDFTPVRPFAVAQATKSVKIEASRDPEKPNLFLLVDRSGSMTSKINGGPATRMTEMQSAMGTFLGSFATGKDVVAHMGMAPFAGSKRGETSTPTMNYQCYPMKVEDILNHIESEELDVTADDNSEFLRKKALDIKTKIEALTPGASTPTAASLRELAKYDTLMQSTRKGFVMLLTDGEPNCANGESTPSNASGNNDVAGTLTAIQALKEEHNIQTIVVGFGNDTALASNLDQMGARGGFLRKCTMDADCKVGKCLLNQVDSCGNQSGVCEKKYFTAQNASDLSDVLAAVSKSITCDVNQCRFYLTTQPSKPEYISVVKNGEVVPFSSGEWTYLQDIGAIEFGPNSPTCNELKASVKTNPIDIEFRVIQVL